MYYCVIIQVLPGKTQAKFWSVIVVQRVMNYTPSPLHFENVKSSKIQERKALIKLSGSPQGHPWFDILATLRLCVNSGDKPRYRDSHRHLSTRLMHMLIQMGFSSTGRRARAWPWQLISSIGSSHQVPQSYAVMTDLAISILIPDQLQKSAITWTSQAWDMSSGSLRIQGRGPLALTSWKPIPAALMASSRAKKRRFKRCCDSLLPCLPLLMRMTGAYLL